MGNPTRNSIQALSHIVMGFLFLFAFVQPISVAASHVAYAGAALAWVTKLILGRRERFCTSPLDLPILIYWLLCALSTSLSPLPASSWEGMRKLNLVFLVLVTAHTVASVRRTKQLITALFLGALLSVGYTAWQYAAGVGLRVRDPRVDGMFYRAGIHNTDVLLRVDGRVIHHPEGFVAHLEAKPPGEPLQLRVVHGGGIPVLKDAVPVTITSPVWPRSTTPDELGMRLETARPSRARGFYSHYVSYAAVLEQLTALAFGLWLARRDRFSLTSIGLGALFVVFALTLGATLTRSAWLAAASGCLVQVWFHQRRWFVRVALAVLLVLAIVGTNAAMHRWRGIGLVDLRDPGTDYRLLMWRDGLRLIQEHPWFGVGLYTIRDSWWKFDLAAYKKYPFHWHFHSTPIQLAVELGLPALIAWLALMACYWRVLAKLVATTRGHNDWFVYALSLGILGATSGFLVSSLVQYDFQDSVVVFLFWFLAGLALALRRQVQAAVD